MSDVICPHCHHTNREGSQFCEACGKAVRSAAPSTPRIVDASQNASTPVGRQVQANELRKTAQQARIALLVVACAQILLGAILVAGAGQARVNPELRMQLLTACTVVFAIGVVFFLLSVWARRQPLPAAIVGLALYFTNMILNISSDPRTLTRGILVKMIIIVVLVRAIFAGLRYQQITRDSAGCLDTELDDASTKSRRAA